MTTNARKILDEGLRADLIAALESRLGGVYAGIPLRRDDLRALASRLRDSSIPEKEKDAPNEKAWEKAEHAPYCVNDSHLAGDVAGQACAWVRLYHRLLDARPADVAVEGLASNDALAIVNALAVRAADPLAAKPVEKFSTLEERWADSPAPAPEKKREDPTRDELLRYLALPVSAATWTDDDEALAAKVCNAEARRLFADILNPAPEKKEGQLPADAARILSENAWDLYQTAPEKKEAPVEDMPTREMWENLSRTMIERMTFLGPHSEEVIAAFARRMAAGSMTVLTAEEVLARYNDSAKLRKERDELKEQLTRVREAIR